MHARIVVWILGILVAVSLVFAMFSNSAQGQQIFEKLELDPSAVINRFEIWRLFTYGFLRDLRSPFHLLFNGLTFYFVGPQLEARWGERRFALFIALALLGGGLAVCAAYLLGLSFASVIGFSAVTIGLLIAWGLTYPNNQMLFFGVVPVTGMQLVWLTVGLELVYGFMNNGTSSAAHFGGMLVGFALSMGLWKPQAWRARYQQWQHRRRYRSHFRN